MCQYEVFKSRPMLSSKDTNVRGKRRFSGTLADFRVVMSMSALAICTNPLAREGMRLWPLDRVLDTRGGVHDSSTPAHAGRPPAAQLLRTHGSPLHPYRC